MTMIMYVCIYVFNRQTAWMRSESPKYLPGQPTIIFFTCRGSGRQYGLRDKFITMAEITRDIVT